VNFLRQESHILEQPARTQVGTVLISLAFVGSLQMDGSADESFTLRVQKDEGDFLHMDAVKRRGIEESCVHLRHEGASFEDIYEAATAQVVRVVNRGLFIPCVSRLMEEELSI
jgi:hypothetical protein